MINNMTMASNNENSSTGGDGKINQKRKNKRNNHKSSASSEKESGKTTSETPSNWPLDPTVTVPSTLQLPEDLSGCDKLLQELSGYPPELQDSTLAAYGHMIRCIPRKDRDKDQFNDKRRKGLFARCLNKTKETQQQRTAAQEEEGEPSTSTSSNDNQTPQKKPTPTPAATGLSLSDTIRAAAQTATITLPTTKLRLEQRAASIFHSMDFELQQKALVACDDAASKFMRQKGGERTIKDPVSFFCGVLKPLKEVGLGNSTIQGQQQQTVTSTTYETKQNGENDNNRAPAQRQTINNNDTTSKTKSKQDSTPVTLPKTKFKLEESAAILFHDMNATLQQEALVACDQAALGLIQKGSSIKKPVEFFTTVLQKLQQSKNPTTPVAAATTTSHTQSQATNKTPTKTNERKGGILILDKNAATTAVQQSSKKQSKSTVQILSSPARPKGATSSNNNNRSVSDSGVHNGDAEQVIASLRAELKDRSKQVRDLEKKATDLTKMWESEKYSVGAYKERIQTLESAIHKLQQQLLDKDDYVDEQLEEARQIQDKQAQEQADYKDMVNTFTKMSKELCHEQQEKRELEQIIEAEKAVRRDKDKEIQRLRAELKRSEMLRPTPRNNAPDGRRVQALKRELQLTQDKLAKLTRATGGNKSSLSSHKEKPSLFDFVVGQQEPMTGTPQVLRRRSASVGNDALATEPGSIQILQSPRRTGSIDETTANDTPSGVLEFELPTTHQGEEGELLSSSQPLTECQRQPPPSVSDTMGIQFHGIEKGYDESDDDEDDDYQDTSTEIDFLLASFGDAEIHVESDERRVTRTLHLELDRNSEVIDVHLILSMPEGYPATASLEVEASLAPDTNPSIAARKVAMDALPDLVNVCRWEANGSVGDEALFSVLQTADQWVSDEWHGIQAKRLPADASGKACLPPTGGGYSKLQMARLLLSTHHLVDADKITFVKSTASHYNLGGYIKTGYPGYILVEGLDDNCTFFVESLVQQRAKLRNKPGRKSDSATFSVAGKAVVELDDDLEGARKLPKKLIEIDKSREGMECFREFTTSVELAKYLD